MLALSTSDVDYFTSCLQSTYFPNFITADLFILILFSIWKAYININGTGQFGVSNFI